MKESESEEKSVSGSVGVGVGVAWSWVLEALARSQLLDAPLLYQFYELCPLYDTHTSSSSSSSSTSTSTTAASAAAEAAALTCLEALYPASSPLHHHHHHHPPPHSPLHLLHRISLQEHEHSSQTQTQTDDHHLKSSLHYFINQYKATSPNFALQLLQNTILQGTHSVFKDFQPNAPTHPHSTTVEAPSSPAPRPAKPKTDNHSMQAEGVHLHTTASASPLHSPPNKLKLQTHDGGVSSLEIVAKTSAPDHHSSSQSEDSIASTDSDTNLCMKCNQGDQLLSCSATTCPLLFHDTCLGCFVSFDDRGNFYCPICAYSRTFADYVKAKEEVSVFRKELTLFIGGGSSNPTKHNRNRSWDDVQVARSQQTRNL